MRNVKVAHLSTLLKEAPKPLWIKGTYGASLVRTVQEAGSFARAEDPDLRLICADGILEFSDQRVKLDMDTMAMEVEDVRGRQCKLVFSACQPS